MSKYILTLLILLTILPSLYVAQDSRTADLTDFVDSLITAMPQNSDTDEYKTPSSGQLISWGNIIQDILDGDYSDAHTTAQTIGYKLIEFTDDSFNPDKTFYVLVMNSDSSNYWGTFVYNPLADRQKLFIQSPHPVYDTNTGNQSIRIFENVGARAFLMSGTMRCNSTDTSTCAGTTTVCGGSSKFRISDQAHTVDGSFQETTDVFESNISDQIVIQVHGFSKQGGDPDLIMSNGTEETPSTDYLSTLKTNLLAEDGDLTFKIAHIDTAFDRLFGTTNTQGRLINGSGNPCNLSASSNSSRFLHIEQAYDSLRDNSTNWNKLSNAIENTFSLDPLPVELTSFTAQIFENTVKLFWETATELNNYGFEVQKQNSEFSNQNSIGVYRDTPGWNSIGFVPGYGNSNSPKNYSFTDYFDHSLDLNSSFEYRLKQIDFDGSFEYSNVVEISLIKTLPNKFALFQNYPNPFNPSTTIKYSVPEISLVIIKVFDVLGNEITTLVNEIKAAGTYEVNFDASELSSGVYFYKLNSGEIFSVKKMDIIK